MHPEGGITTNAMAERFDDEEVKIDNDQLGRGKRRKGSINSTLNFGNITMMTPHWQMLSISRAFIYY